MRDMNAGKRLFVRMAMVWAATFVISGLAIDAQAAPPPISLTTVKTGLDLPIGITHAGDGSGRLFLNLQRGTIVIWNGSAILPTPFLDLTTLASCCGEQGLLGVAFHPQYRTNGFFYVNYTDRSTPNSQTVVARYRVSSTDPNRADPNSALVLLRQEQPYSNHNGGQIHFGPDGYLYISMGDGGSGGDPENYSQNPESLLGKMLRIDVNRTEAGRNYAIPATNPYFNANPFPGKTPRREIWAYGLRNAWAFSFDRQTGDLYMGDVGQNNWEEINFQPAASTGGENYGWRLMEGLSCFNPSSQCNNGSLTLPILVYDHGLGCSVTGGRVYRGSQFGALAGTYLYGDVCSGRIWGAQRSGTTWVATQLLDTNHSIVAWGEDEAGELYLANRGGEGGATGGLYRVMSTPSGENIVDNAPVGVADASRQFTGTWCRSSGTGQQGADSLYACGSGRDSYRWRPSIASGGNYDVYVRWTTAPIRSNSVPFAVTHADGVTTKVFDQTSRGGQWVLHGSYRFAAGTEGYVEVDDVNGVTNADAIRLLPSTGPTVATLRVGVAGEGSGRVTSAPAGIDCGTDCNQDYAINTSVTLTAIADPGSVFFEWGGPCVGAGQCTIVMNDSKFLAATFKNAGVVIDNARAGVQDVAGGRTYTGGWCPSSVTPFYGTGALYSCSTRFDTYRWTPKITQAGAYDVYIRWSSTPTRSTAVPVTVVHATGSQVVRFNQTLNGGKWMLVGRYTFNAGTGGYVQMSEDANGQALADAIQLVPVP